MPPRCNAMPLVPLLSLLVMMFLSPVPCAGIETPVPAAPPLDRNVTRNVVIHGGQLWMADRLVADDILILNSYHRGQTAGDELIQSFIDTLNSDNARYEFWVEQMDFDRHPEKHFQQELKMLYHKKYMNRRLRLMLVIGADALEFVRINREAIFIGVPILYADVAGTTPPDLPENTIATVSSEPDYAGTVELALSLIPETRRVVVINPADVRTDVSRRLQPLQTRLQGQVRFEFWNDRRQEDLEQRFGKLGAGTVALAVAAPLTRSGRQLNIRQAVDRLHRVGKTPIFSVWHDTIGVGAVGGRIISSIRAGQVAARIAVRYIAGEALDGLPTGTQSPSESVLDYRLLRELGILPPAPGRQVRLVNQPHSAYSEHRGVINAVIAFVAIQTVIIILLIVASRRRKAAEQSLASARDELEIKVAERTSQLQTANQQLQAEVMERQRAEGELQKHQDELENIVLERTSELIRTNQELEGVAYSISHDLKAPLRGVEAYAQFLTEELDEASAARVHPHIAEIRTGIQRFGNMLDGLLAHARLGEAFLTVEEVDLNVLLDQIVDGMSSQLEDNMGTIRLNKPLPRVLGDSGVLDVMFRNLIANGIKFARPEVPPALELSSREEPDAWHFTIEDNGIGIDPRYRDEVFRVFKRLHTNEEFPGVGIGLAMVKKAADLHNGRVWFQPAARYGTVFHVLIRKFPLHGDVPAREQSGGG